MPEKLIRKALSVTTGGLTDFLPSPLAARVIEFITESNIMRNLITIMPMPARTFTIPSQDSDLSAYYAPDGSEAVLTSFTSGSITLTAKKLFSQVLIDTEVVEDSQPDVINLVLQSFGRAVGVAEEKAILQGDTTHTATAQTPAQATTANWFVGDPRVMWNGLFALADSSINSSCATEVDAGGAEFQPIFVNKLLYNLGKYGQNKSEVICLIDPAQAANLRSDSTFTNAQVSGLQLSSAITGINLGRALNNGLITTLYGVAVYEAAQAVAGKAVMFYKKSPLLADRRRIKIASEEVLRTDQLRYVVSERIAFGNQWADSIGRITNLQTSVGT